MERLAAPIRTRLRRNKGSEPNLGTASPFARSTRKSCGTWIEFADVRVEFRLLYLRANRLERWEIIEADSALAAVEEAARRPSDDVTELWSDRGRIAIFRPVGAQINI